MTDRERIEALLRALKMKSLQRESPAFGGFENFMKRLVDPVNEQVMSRGDLREPDFNYRGISMRPYPAKGLKDAINQEPWLL